ncbi:late control protein D [Clostridium aciditolerans]
MIAYPKEMQLRDVLDWNIVYIISIDNKPNEHGYLYLKCLINDSINFQSAINASTSDKICIYEETEDENTSNESPVNINVVKESKSKILFNGIVQNIKTSNVNGVYYLEIQALTSGFELDIKEKSRSFQNASMTYNELIGIILKDYSGYSYTQCTAEGQTIGKPLFQYKETDWNFLKRIASELNSELFCDIMEIRNMFYFGRPIKASYEIEDMGFYKAHKNLKRFHEAGGIEAGHDTDYFYYEIERREKYEVGDKIRFKNKELYVNQYSAYALKDEVIYKYRLCRKNGIWQTKIYNSLLSGGSLEGKVAAVEGEEVKLHLDIDKGQNKEAAWFPYAPLTGNAMYSMPVVGTSARLYFPNESSEAPILAGCVRKNGSDREKYPPFNDEPKTGQKTEKKQEKLLISFIGCSKKIF